MTDRAVTPATEPLTATDGPNTHKMAAPSDVTSWTTIHTTREVVADDGRDMVLRQEWWHVPSFVVAAIEARLSPIPAQPASEPLCQECGQPFSGSDGAHNPTCRCMYPQLHHAFIPAQPASEPLREAVIEAAVALEPHMDSATRMNWPSYAARYDTFIDAVDAYRAALRGEAR